MLIRYLFVNGDNSTLKRFYKVPAEDSEDSDVP